MSMEFYTNNKNKVVAILRTKRAFYRGEAHLNPEDGDVFNPELGMMISGNRAKIRRNTGKIMGYRDQLALIKKDQQELDAVEKRFKGKIRKLQKQNDKLRAAIKAAATHGTTQA